jgi:hypothetical protein
MISIPYRQGELSSPKYFGKIFGRTPEKKFADRPKAKKFAL